MSSPPPPAEYLHTWPDSWQRGGHGTAGEVLAELLRRLLLEEKLLVDEMSPLDKHDKGKESATFLGVAQPNGPGSLYRRIDFKVSCAQSSTFAHVALRAADCWWSSM